MFNFVPETALAFHKALNSGDDATGENLLKDCYYPYASIRTHKSSYAVSAIKAGVARWMEVGHVRTPLTDLIGDDIDDARPDRRPTLMRVGPSPS